MANRISKSFLTTRYVDLDAGNDANSGTTAAQAWRTLAKVTSAEFTGKPIGTALSVLVILAGTSGGTNATSTGVDQFTYDAITAGRTASTEIGIRMWKTADGARPSSGAIARPVLRADTAFSSLTQIGVTTVYKSNVLTAGTLLIGDALFKPTAISQQDVDGAWKTHMLITGQAAGIADATIAANLVVAGNNTAYYKTDTREVFVNTNGLTGGTTASNWGWSLDQATANFSKIRPIGFSYIGVEDIDTLYGERGIAVFDANYVEIYNCRVYEPGVHGIICSYTNYALKNIIIDGCEVYGLGSSATGMTMIAVTGQSGGFDLSNVRITNCKCKRYMLQNPSGTMYTTAQYPIDFLGIGTAANPAYGLTKDAYVGGCMFSDVTTAKTDTVRAGIGTFQRCQTPSDLTSFNAYPIRFENCYFSTLGTWLFYQDTDYGDAAIAFKNCRIECASPDATLFTWGVRYAIVLYEPATAGTKQSIGIFGNTQWAVDIGLGDAANTFGAFGPHNQGGAGAGLRSYITARDSTIYIVTKAAGLSPLFEQNSTNSVADKDVFLDVQNCNVGCVLPVGTAVTNAELVGRDLPAAGNTSRIFLNNRYFNINQAAFSAANATYANFVTNVDPQAELKDQSIYQSPNFAQGATVRNQRIVVATDQRETFYA